MLAVPVLQSDNSEIVLDDQIGHGCNGAHRDAGGLTQSTERLDGPTLPLTDPYLKVHRSTVQQQRDNQGVEQAPLQMSQISPLDRIPQIPYLALPDDPVSIRRQCPSHLVEGPEPVRVQFAVNGIHIPRQSVEQRD